MTTLSHAPVHPFCNPLTELHAPGLHVVTNPFEAPVLRRLYSLAIRLIGPRRQLRSALGLCPTLKRPHAARQGGSVYAEFRASARGRRRFASIVVKQSAQCTRIFASIVTCDRKLRPKVFLYYGA